MVKLYAGSIWTRFYGLAEYDIKQLTERLAFRPLNYYFTPRYQSGDWDGWIRLFYNKHGNYFTYTGLVPRILKIFNADGVDYEIIKEYSHNNVEIIDTELSNITLRDYQKDIVQTCKSKKRGIIKAATGAGKTEIFIKIISDINLKSLIIVNRSTLFRQTVEKVKKRLELRDSEINYIGDIKNYNPDNKITIATFQSLLTKDKETDKLLYEQLLKNTGIIIVDEAHHVSANELGNLLKIANKTLYRFGFTATPEREDGYDMMIEAMIGPRIYDISISTLIQMGYLSKPHIYFLRQEYTSGITDMKKHDNTKYIKATKAIFNQQQRNENMIKIAMKFAEKGKLVLISFAKVEHLNNVYKILKEMNTNFKIKKVTGKDTANTKEQTINKMKEREYDIVLATLFGEGVDVENLDVLINARASKSEIDVYQQVGRVVRLSPGKKPVVIDFLDYDPAIKDDKKKKLKDYFKSYSNKKIKLLKSEPEFEVEVIDTIDQIKELED